MAERQVIGARGDGPAGAADLPMLDITGADSVEVMVRDDSRVLWVSVSGTCVLRVCRISRLGLAVPGEGDAS